MGRLRFKLWLYKLKEMKIKGLRRRRLAPLPSLCKEGARNLSSGPPLLCCSSRSVEIHWKACFAKSRFSLCPVNHKALDILFPASPRSPLLVSSRLSPRSIGLLNSPVVDPFAYSSPNLSTKVISTNVTVRSQNSLALDFGCNPASSIRKVEENVHNSCVGKAFDDHHKHSKKRSEKVDKKKRHLASKAALEKAVVMENKVEKIREKRSKSTKVPYESVRLSPAGGASEGQDRLETYWVSKSTDTIKSKFENPKTLTGVEGIDCNLCIYKLGNCSVVSTLDSCPHTNSFSSDDFFLSSEKGRASNSSNSSSEFLERSRTFSMDGALRDARAADQSLFDGYALGTCKSISEETREFGKEGKKKVGLYSESSRSRKNLRLQRSQGTRRHYQRKDDQQTLLTQVTADSEPGTLRSWLCHESSTRSFDAQELELESSSKAWTEYSSPDMTNQDDDSADETDECILFWNQTLHRERRRKAARTSRARRLARSRREARLPRSAQSSHKTLALNTEGKINKSTKTGKLSTLQNHDVDDNAKLPGSSFIPKGRVCDSVAVVKSSRDPYFDFRDSMVNMILEKQIFESSDLEQLLQCFLSLNSLEHHDTIVRAFTEVWDAVFGDNAARSLIPSS
eukprot:c20986_g1_i1 orf=162-2036(-)